MSRICIIALVGLPAAGKTTFSQQLLSWAGLPFNVVHFCFDDFFQYNTLQQPKHFDFKTERKNILMHLQSIVDSLKSSNVVQPTGLEHKLPTTSHNSKDYVILCDDNNYYTSMRYKIYQMCKTQQVYYGQIYFPIDSTLCLQRNAQRNIQDQVPQHIVEQMFMRLEVPNPKKNFWESFTLNFDASLSQDSAFACVLNFVASVFQHFALNPATTVEMPTKEEQYISPLHSLDIMLRRRIKEILGDPSLTRESKKTKAELLNLKRKEILVKYNKCTASEIEESFSLEHSSDICKLLH